MLGVLTTKAELVKEIQKVIPDIDAKSLMQTNLTNLYLIFDIVT
jgi:hypothetical protein